MAAPKKAVGPKSDKLWRNALMLAVNRAVEKGKPTKRLAMIADVCTARALSGDMAAIKEIGDRLDGRPHQPITDGEGGPFKVIVEIIDPTRRDV